MFSEKRKIYVDDILGEMPMSEQEREERRKMKVKQLKMAVMQIFPKKDEASK